MAEGHSGSRPSTCAVMLAHVAGANGARVAQSMGYTASIRWSYEKGTLKLEYRE